MLRHRLGTFDKRDEGYLSPISIGGEARSRPLQISLRDSVRSRQRQRHLGANHSLSVAVLRQRRRICLEHIGKTLESLGQWLLRKHVRMELCQRTRSL
jgi:hypothetical protein